MAIKPTASAECAIPFVTAANARGVETRDLLARAGLEGDVFERAVARWPADRLARLIGEAARLSGDPHFGLHAARGIGVSTCEVLSYSAQSPETFEEFLHYGGELFPLVHSGIRFHLEREGAVARWCGEYVPGFRGRTRHEFEYYAHGFLIIMRRALGPDFQPDRVRFGHERRATEAVYERIFGVAPEFDRGGCEIEFDAGWLDRTVRPLDPLVIAAVERFARETGARLSLPRRFSDQVREAIESALMRGEASRERVAANLATSGRTLQRRLNDEGTHFHALRDEVRARLAKRLLKEETDLSVAEIGYRLGFSEPSAFHRAFRRWAGLTPTRYRTRGEHEPAE